MITRKLGTFPEVHYMIALCLLIKPTMIQWIGVGFSSDIQSAAVVPVGEFKTFSCSLPNP